MKHERAMWIHMDGAQRAMWSEPKRAICFLFCVPPPGLVATECRAGSASHGMSAHGLSSTVDTGEESQPAEDKVDKVVTTSELEVLFSWEGTLWMLQLCIIHTLNEFFYDCSATSLLVQAKNECLSSPKEFTLVHERQKSI